MYHGLLRTRLLGSDGAPRQALHSCSGQGSLPTVHSHLHVRTISDAVPFYRSCLGSSPVKPTSGYAKFLPDWTPWNVALSEDASEIHGIITSHLGIQLASPEAIQAPLARVMEAGLQVRAEMGITCCHANQDTFSVSDPAGVECEACCLTVDVDEDVHAWQSSTACCAC